MDRGHLAKRENTPTYRGGGDRLAGTKTESALNLEVLSRSFAPVRDFLVFDDLPLIETAEAGSFDRRDVDKHISAAATLRLNEAIALGRIEPLYSAFRHYLLQATLRRANDHSAPEKKKDARRRPVSIAGGETVGYQTAIRGIVTGRRGAHGDHRPPSKGYCRQYRCWRSGAPVIHSFSTASSNLLASRNQL